MGTLNTKLRKVHFWEIASILLLIILFASFSKDIFSPSQEEIGKRVTEYINTNILQGQGEAVLESIEERGDLYLLTLSIDGQPFESYATKDGKLIFPQGIEIETNGEVIPATGGSVVNTCEHIDKVDRPQLDMFVMSFCPYGQQAQSLIIPVAKFFGDWMDINPWYVSYPPSYYAGKEAEFCEEDVCAMHGLGELHENMRQACVWKYDKNEYWTYVGCIIEKCDYSNIDECWEQCTEDMNKNEIKLCQKDEGVALMKRSMNKMQEHGVSGSETLIINNERLQMSSYRWDPNKLRELICCGFNNQPDICEKTITGVTATAGGAGSC